MAAKNEKKTKDQAMAARMKADGVKRTHLRCPICGKVIPMAQGYTHVAYHPA